MSVKENGRKGYLLLINWTGILDDRWDMWQERCDMLHDRINMPHDTWWHDIIVITSEMTCDMKLHCICQKRHVTWQT